MIIQPTDYYNPIIHIKPTKIIGVDSQKWQRHIKDFMTTESQFGVNNKWMYSDPTPIYNMGIQQSSRLL